MYIEKEYDAGNLIALYNHLRSTDFITPCLVWVYLGKYNKSGACQWLVAPGCSFLLIVAGMVLQKVRCFYNFPVDIWVITNKVTLLLRPVDAIFHFRPGSSPTEVIFPAKSLPEPIPTYHPSNSWMSVEFVSRYKEYYSRKEGESYW